MNRPILVFGILVLSLGCLSFDISREDAAVNIDDPISTFEENRLMYGVSVQNQEKEEPEDLEQILGKVAEYCQRLERVSLHFVCNEEIKERLYYFGRFFRENTYIYDILFSLPSDHHQPFHSLHQTQQLKEKGKSRLLIFF